MSRRWQGGGRTGRAGGHGDEWGTGQQGWAAADMYVLSECDGMEGKNLRRKKKKEFNLLNLEVRGETYDDYR